MNAININARAFINLYTKSLVFVYPEKENVQVKHDEKVNEPQNEQSVLYEDKDGKVVVKGVSDNGGKPIKR